MSWEIYSGPLCRYYGDVETYEEEQRTLEIVRNWRDSIVPAVQKAAPETKAWEESAELDYLVLQMEAMHLGALLAVASAGLYGEKPRETVYPGWNWEAELTVQRARADRNLIWSLFKGATWWLPAQTPVLMRGQIPTGQTVTISSAGALMLELLRVNELTWKADDEEVLSWLGIEGKMPAEAKRYGTDTLAKYAYSALWQVAKYALQHNLPIIMDNV